MSSCKGSSVNNMLKTQGGGGIRKKNGHKANCKCPICVNMKHAKGGATRARREAGPALGG